MKPLVSLVALAIASGLLSAAQAAGRDRPKILVRAAPGVYQPVCGTDPSGTRVTCSNACFARVAKATNVTPGECPS